MLINYFVQNSIIAIGLIVTVHMSLDSVLLSLLQDTHVSFETVNRVRISYLVRCFTYFPTYLHIIQKLLSDLVLGVSSLTIN